MGMPDSGYFFHEPGPVLAQLVVTEEGDTTFDSTEIEVLYQPTEEDIRRICEKWRFDFEKTIALIRGKRPEIHTMFIDATKYREVDPA